MYVLMYFSLKKFKNNVNYKYQLNYSWINLEILKNIFLLRLFSTKIAPLRLFFE